MMTFPKTVDEFMESYKVVDTDGIYMSKDAELVPIFRMKQWFEHLEYIERKRGKWMNLRLIYTDVTLGTCSNCGKRIIIGDYCKGCGADMRNE